MGFFSGLSRLAAGVWRAVKFTCSYYTSQLFSQLGLTERPHEYDLNSQNQENERIRRQQEQRERLKKQQQQQEEENRLKQEEIKKAKILEEIKKLQEEQKRQKKSKERKRLDSPVCPSKKTCNSLSCELPSCFLCSNCNTYFCSDCLNAYTSANSKEDKKATGKNKKDKCPLCIQRKEEGIIQEFQEIALHILCVMFDKVENHEYDCFLKTCKHVFHQECLLKAHIEEKLPLNCSDCHGKFTLDDVSKDFFDPTLGLDKYCDKVEFGPENIENNPDNKSL